MKDSDEASYPRPLTRTERVGHAARSVSAPNHMTSCRNLSTTMGFKCGIVGLPNVGKSTLFNALTQTAAAQAANYPFCTIEPNVGEVAVPDPRLDALAAIAARRQIIPTRLTFVDIAGLVRGASKGEGLGNQFLANIREVDAIAHVVRCFEDGDVTHVEGEVDPIADIETIETELMLADLDSLEKRVVGAREEGQAAATRKPRSSLTWSSARCSCCARASRPASSSASPRKSEAFQDARPADRQARALRLQRRRGLRRRAGTPSRQGVRARRGGGRGGGRRLGQDRERDRRAAAEEQADYLEAVGLDRARPQPRHPRRLRAPGISSPTSPSAPRRRAPGRSPRAPGPRRRRA